MQIDQTRPSLTVPAASYADACACAEYVPVVGARLGVRDIRDMHPPVALGTYPTDAKCVCAGTGAGEGAAAAALAASPPRRRSRRRSAVGWA
eukprot:672255-Prymnesium_polylepis.1